MKKTLILTLFLSLFLLAGCTVKMPWSQKTINQNGSAILNGSPDGVVQTDSRTMVTDKLQSAFKVKYPEANSFQIAIWKSDKDENAKDIAVVGDVVIDSGKKQSNGTTGFLAVKNSDDSWQIVYSGDTQPTCVDLAKVISSYSVSDSLLSGFCIK